MQARRVGFRHGWLWIRQAFGMIARNPVLSIVFAALAGLAIFLLMMVPLLGPLLGVLLLPTMIAGYMRACQAMERHEEPALAHLLTGFRIHTPRLIALGGFLLVGVLATVAAMVSIGGDPLLEFLKKAQEITDETAMRAALEAAGETVTTAFLAGSGLFLLLSICLQFAPMRVLFDDEPPLAAIKSSLLATLRNVLPYIAYSLMLYLIVMLISVLPLPIALALNVTISMTSLYAAYRDIFYAAPQAGSLPPRAPDEQAHF